ncbi:hypothetical protein CIB95_09740 [Lottiidibacillus patelloidae]|uniref:Uncharacterized protein n=1 Tax=Lottiidibacillus patelloidae TaxID=2670334 RepID=A0A263BTR2_9BACI|nr:hypothetical protein CIB95_09740 [Lottiidibacillus patelloidae]
MDFWFYLVIAIGIYLLYYGYIAKKKYEFRGKEMEIQLKHKKLELEMKKLELKQLDNTPVITEQKKKA